MMPNRMTTVLVAFFLVINSAPTFAGAFFSAMVFKAIMRRLDVYAIAGWDGGYATLTAASARPCLPATRESSTLTLKIHG